MSVRYLCVGLPKSGTSTMVRALTSAGIPAVHGSIPGHPPLAFLLMNAFNAGEPPLSRVPPGVEALSDACITGSPKWGGVVAWPIADQIFLAACRDSHPECRFILHERSAEDWIRSVDNWKNFRRRVVDSHLPGLPSGAGSDDRELADWYEGHSERVTQVLGGDRLLRFRIDGPNARQQLEDFLGRQLGWWGIANANPRAVA